jgi:hypothetical protein
VGKFGRFEEVVVLGFAVKCVPKPAFWLFAFPPRVLGRVVPTVDAAALRETWGLASRIKKDRQRDLCVFLMGPEVAPAGELERVIFDQQRKLPPAAGRLVMVPVNTRDWSAHVPTNVPLAVKSLLARLRV